MSSTNAKILQFPLKQHQVTQQVRDGRIWYVYVIWYPGVDNQLEPVYFWALDDNDAMLRLEVIRKFGSLGGRLKDHVTPPPQATD